MKEYCLGNDVGLVCGILGRWGWKRQAHAITVLGEGKRVVHAVHAKGAKIP